MRLEVVRKIMEAEGLDHCWNPLPGIFEVFNLKGKSVTVVFEEGADDEG